MGPNQTLLTAKVTDGNSWESAPSFGAWLMLELGWKCWELFCDGAVVNVEKFLGPRSFRIIKIKSRNAHTANRKWLVWVWMKGFVSWGPARHTTVSTGCVDCGALRLRFSSNCPFFSLSYYLRLGTSQSLRFKREWNVLFCAPSAWLALCVNVSFLAPSQKKSKSFSLLKWY